MPFDLTGDAISASVSDVPPQVSVASPTPWVFNYDLGHDQELAPVLPATQEVGQGRLEGGVTLVEQAAKAFAWRRDVAQP